LESQVGFIYELFVLPDSRRRGIGKQLLKTAISHLKQKGYEEIRLSVFAGNPAIRIYEKLGFQQRTITLSLSL